MVGFLISNGTTRIIINISTIFTSKVSVRWNGTQSSSTQTHRLLEVFTPLVTFLDLNIIVLYYLVDKNNAVYI
jgi:hypothetical protein